MNFKPLTKLIFVSIILFSLSIQSKAQTSISLKSQWLDPTNLFTEKKPTAEFNTTFPVSGNWSMTFYYAHDLENLSPIYLFGGVNYSNESIKKDSLSFSIKEARVFPKYSNNLFLSYQFSETQNQVSWIQPTYTWNWNFLQTTTKSVHTITAEMAAWMSIQRGDLLQDGAYIKGQYNYAKHFEKWILNANISTLVLGIKEPTRNIFVLGEVLNLSSTFVPFNTTLDVILNKPLITKDNSDFGFTVGLIHEF